MPADSRYYCDVAAATWVLWERESGSIFDDLFEEWPSRIVPVQPIILAC